MTGNTLVVNHNTLGPIFKKINVDVKLFEFISGTHISLCPSN